MLVYCDPSSENSRLVFKIGGLNTTKLIVDADLFWCRAKYEKYFTALKSHQILNHLPNEKSICGKGLLAETLSSSPCSQYSLLNILPVTYCLYNQNEVDKFLLEKNDHTWIFKPAFGAGGQDTMISFGKDLTSEKVFEYQNKFIYGKKKDYIVQKYILNPYLIDGRKFSIRCYWLVALNPLRVWLYPEGTAKLCTHDYTPDSFEDNHKHLTNSEQNKNEENYDPKINKLEWRDLPFGRDTMIELCLDQLERLIKLSEHELTKTEPNYCKCFAVLASDWVLDSNMNLWLTEVQRNFGMLIEDKVKQSLFPEMFNDILNFIYNLLVNENGVGTRLIPV